MAVANVKTPVVAKPSTKADVLIRGIAAGGSGVGTLPDGRIVFVPRSAPGDLARIRIEKSKRSWAEGSLEKVLDPAEDRRAPLCDLYTECGGCTLQHLPELLQIEWKARIVADALTRIGGLGAVDVPPITASPRATHYRNRVTLTLRRLPHGHVVAGFHGLGRPAHVVDVEDQCVLPEPELSAAWIELRSGWGPGARLLPEAGRLRLTLRNTGSGVVLIVDGGKPGWDAESLAAAVPRLVAVWHQARGEAVELVAGRVVEEVWGGETYPVFGDTFVQVNREAAALLADHVLGVSGQGDRAVDAYCGLGQYGRELARRGWTATGIELAEGACTAAAHGAPSGFSVVCGAVEEELAGLLPADLLIVNPPRSGLDASVSEVILEALPPRLVYVSCDPGTLARDLGVLAGAYRIRDLHCFDLFPQTAHVETVAVLAAHT